MHWRMGNVLHHLESVCSSRAGSSWQPYSGFRGKGILPLQVLLCGLLSSSLPGLIEWLAMVNC